MGFDSVDVSDDDLARSVQELGAPEALFRVSRARFAAKLLVGVGLTVFGVVANYLWWTEGPGLQHFHVIHLLLLGPLITGCGLLWHMYRQRGLVILIYPTGLLRLCRGEVDSFPWGEIENVRVIVQRAASAETVRDPDGTLTACWLAAETPTFRLWKSGLFLSRADGVETRISAALSGYVQLAEEVQKRTFAAQWPQIWERFLSGVPIPFGDLEVSRRGVLHKGKWIRWRDMKEISVLQGMLQIKQLGKWIPIKYGELLAIPNPHILFALTKEAQRTAVHS